MQLLSVATGPRQAAASAANAVGDTAKQVLADEVFGASPSGSADAVVVGAASASVVVVVSASGKGSTAGTTLIGAGGGTRGIVGALSSSRSSSGTCCEPETSDVDVVASSTPRAAGSVPLVSADGGCPSRTSSSGVALSTVLSVGGASAAHDGKPPRTTDNKTHSAEQRMRQNMLWVCHIGRRTSKLDKGTAISASTATGGDGVALQIRVLGEQRTCANGRWCQLECQR